MSDFLSPKPLETRKDIHISIIIPTFNRIDTIGLTLESLIAQNYPANLFEIIVVDNASTDGTRDLVMKFSEAYTIPVIRYAHESRPGVHYARNHGAQIAKYELLYFTDDDVVADSEMLSEVIKPFILDSRVGCVAGRVLPIWQVSPPLWVRRHCYNSLLSILDIPQDFIIAPHLDYIYSCHMALWKKVLFDSGGFNPENTGGNWIGDGETGLVIKIEKLGYKFGFNGASVTRHLIPQSRMTQSYLVKRMGNSGNSYAFTYYRKNRPSSIVLFVDTFVLMFLKMMLRVVEYVTRSILSRDLDYLRFIPAYFMYYYRRGLYNMRLMQKVELREYVLRDNWLDIKEELNG